MPDTFGFVPKKARTPPPPRRVQAPKVRTGHDRKSGGPAAPSFRERLSLPIVAGVIAVLVIAGVLAGVLATRGGSSSSSSGGIVKVSPTDLVGDMTKLPGIALGKPPWGPNDGATLTKRLDSLGIPKLGQESLAFHIHQHLDVYDNGKHVLVPPLIGISTQGQYFADVHTHAGEPGTIHIESATAYDYTLGQFFGVWGVRLSPTCIGGLCEPAGRRLHVWVNGKPFLGDPTRIVLVEHLEIVIAFGTPPTTIPSKFDFRGL